jgi:hypothetical protein
MTRRIVLTGTATAALAASLLSAPAYAEGEFAITVTPASGTPTTQIMVTGDAVDPLCPDDGVAVSLNYTNPNGTLTATTVNTVTDAAGHFSAQLTVPETAYAGEQAYVVAVIADCNPPNEASVARSSESVDFDVLANAGDFEISATSGEPGDTLDFAGTNCWGGVVYLFFGDEVLEGEPEPDRTFEGSVEVPDLPDGTYQIAAECPGTDYPVRSFRLINPEAPAAPPASPVVRPPTFTG